MPTKKEGPLKEASFSHSWNETRKIYKRVLLPLKSESPSSNTLWHYQTAVGILLCVHRKGDQRASADVGLMFTALNLRRLINIIDNV